MAGKPEIPSAQVGVVSFGADKARRRHLKNGTMQLLCDRLGRLPGQRDQVVRVTIIAFGPHVRVAGRLNQLDSHVHLVAGAGDRSFQYTVDPKLPSYLRQGAARPLVLHDGCSGDDA